jgi:2-C-methyl-D-erythritol 4-phosphate cytidylyltransferase
VAKDDWVLVHDAARPCIQKELVEQFLDEIGDDPRGRAPRDAARRHAEDAPTRTSASRRPSRGSRSGARRRRRCSATTCCAAASRRSPQATDEAEAVESLGYYAPRLVQGENTTSR